MIESLNRSNTGRQDPGEANKLLNTTNFSLILCWQMLSMLATKQRPPHAGYGLPCTATCVRSNSCAEDGHKDFGERPKCFEHRCI